MNTSTQQSLITTIFRHIPQYVFWKDRHSVYLGCNQQYARLLGLDCPEDIIGKTDEALGWLSDGDTADTFRAGDQETLAGRAITNAQEWLSLPNGVKILTLINKVPLVDDSQQIFGVLGVATDITEHKQLADRLAQTHHQLNGMRIISASIAHELRTPLATLHNGITSITQLLPTLIAGFQAAQAHHLPITALSAHHLQLLDTVLNRLNRQVEQIEQVIDSLLTHVTEHHAHAQHLVVCSAASCIDQALADYLFPTDGKPVIDWESQHDFDIKVNPLLIKHVLFNLLKNACYFIRKAGKGQIFIWLEQGLDDNTIHFKDTAMGIKPNHLPHIFDYLYSVDTNQGTGIGLAFCTNVLQAYGGSITCHSVYGEYAEFVLTFPRLP